MARRISVAMSSSARQWSQRRHPHSAWSSQSRSRRKLLRRLRRCQCRRNGQHSPSQSCRHKSRRPHRRLPQRRWHLVHPWPQPKQRQRQPQFRRNPNPGSVARGNSVAMSSSVAMISSAYNRSRHLCLRQRRVRPSQESQRRKLRHRQSPRLSGRLSPDRLLRRLDQRRQPTHRGPGRSRVAKQQSLPPARPMTRKMAAMQANARTRSASQRSSPDLMAKTRFQVSIVPALSSRMPVPARRHELLRFGLAIRCQVG